MDHTAVFFAGEQGEQRGFEVRRLRFVFDARADQVRQLLQLISGFVVAGFNLVRPRAGNQDNFLPQMIKSNHLVKQHQVDVLKCAVLVGEVQRGFGIADVRVGEITDQAAGKRRHPLNFGAVVFVEQAADRRPGVGDLFGELRACTDAEFAALARQLCRGVEPEEGVPSPLPGVLGAFQHVAVAADMF